MTREIKAMSNQYGARRTRLKEHLLPPLKQEAPLPRRVQRVRRA